MRKRYPFLAACLVLSLSASAQLGFVRGDSIPVYSPSQLNFPWAGGLNFCQFSEIDLDQDGLLDLFVFDRTGNRITTYINTGTPNQISYKHAPEYQRLFPDLHDWAVLRDYNCDGKADIFTYQSPGFRVFENTSTGSNLQFTLRYNIVLSDYNPQGNPNMVNLYVSPVDIPAIRDIDNDGDLDVLTFSILGSFIEYHENTAMQSPFGCDTLMFELGSYCWGNFSENALNNSIALNQSCRMASPEATDDGQINHQPDQLLHAGSCLECIDIDRDDDKEVVIGDISATNSVMVRNGGTPQSALGDSVDANYPSYDSSVAMAIFPCAFQVDVNNDNKKDLVFSPNVTTAAENYKSVWLYNNTGLTDSVVADFAQNNFLQDHMIEVGEGAYPVWYDYDADGDQDLFIGNYGYYNSGQYHSKIALYKNTGSAANPSFLLQTTDFAFIFGSGSGIQNLAFSFGDLDGDGDKDLLIGDYNGKLHFYQKLPGNPDNFVIAQPNYQGIDVGSFAAPQIIDVDRDGLLDLLIGRQSPGRLSYYRNTGTASNPVFTQMSSFFGGVEVNAPFYSTGHSAPFLYDVGGSYKLLVGSESGWIWHFDNIDGNLAGNFNLIDSTYMDIWEGARTHLSGADVNGDAIMDLAIGNYSGGVALYLGDNNVSTGSLYGNDDAAFELYPNPASGSVTVNVPEFSVYVDVRFGITNLLGQQVMNQTLSMQRTAINISALPKGVYICTLEIDGKRAQRKLIVQQ